MAVVVKYDNGDEDELTDYTVNTDKFVLLRLVRLLLLLVARKVV